MTERLVKTDYFEVEPGRVIGLRQVAQTYTDEGKFMTLIFIAALEAENDGDTIEISGRPNLDVKCRGTNGDIATIAIAVNAIRRIKEVAPGLVTTRDLPIVTLW